jgi:putative endopeptidase
MKFQVSHISTCVLILVCASAGGQEASPPPMPEAPFSGMDRSVRPGTDFYDFANGAWQRSVEIPADLSGYSVWAQLAEQNRQRLTALFNEIASSSPPANTAKRKVVDYYSSFMDENTIETRGLSVLTATFDRIHAIKDRAELARFLGTTLRSDVDVLNDTQLYTDNLFGLWVAQDLDNPARYAPFLLQGGLGMPDRDYYLSSAPKMADIRAQYQSHIATVLKLCGEPNADRKASEIYALERRIALVHSSRTDAEDVSRGDNHWTLEQLRARAPGMDWHRYLDAAGLGSQTVFVVWQPHAVTGIAALVASERLETWKEYLKFHAIEHGAAFLPKAFVDERFAFYGKVLDGTPELSPRWKRAVEHTNSALGEAVGELYVQRYFPPQSKSRIEDLVRHLVSAFAARIDALAWMTPETKVKAKAKLSTLKVGVGYPDHWRDYSDLSIVVGDAFGNFTRSEAFEYRRNIHKLRQPVDRSEWVMTPQVINAVNLPVMNALNFPAGVLQPPFFDPNRPDAMNYGAVGAIIGHEISHSFDEEGAKFNATGQLENWWAAADYAHFRASATLLVEQFDAYRPFPDLAVNGKQTLGENIADVAGLAVAYSAYRQALQDRTAPVVEGFNGDQQFFLSFAQAFRGKYRDAALRRAIITDGHAPDQYRTLTVRNNDAWYGAFDVKPGDPLYLEPARRVQMW